MLIQSSEVYAIGFYVTRHTPASSTGIFTAEVNTSGEVGNVHEALCSLRIDYQISSCLF